MVDVAEGFVALAARAGRLLPGLVDVAPEVRRRAAAEPRLSASALVGAAGRLALAVPDAGLGAARARFLVGQLGALEFVGRWLAGQRVPFVQDVAATFGVAIRPGAEDDYRGAHCEIAELLPGRGPLTERLAAHRRRDEVPADRLPDALVTLSEALRERTRECWRLPDGERVTYRLVADAPWTALHTWLGEHRSVVTVNVSARLRWAQLPSLVAHEAYPGHHTQRCRAETEQVARGRPEHGVVVVRSPRAVVAEGAAEAGLGVLVGPAWGRWAEGVLGRLVGTAGGTFDGGLAGRLDLAARRLLPVRQDAALLLHERPAGYGSGHVARRAAARHLRHWLLVDAERACRILRSLESPLWRGHVVAQVEGVAMVNSWLRRGAGPRTERFRHLLDEPVVPADLLLTARAGAERSAAVRVPTGRNPW